VLFLPLALPLVAVGVAVSFGALSESGRVLQGLGFLGLYDAVFALLAWGTYEHVIGD
jgi:ABC-type transport system involved in cytochrome c biogenesis permease component